jgi:integrase
MNTKTQRAYISLASHFYSTRLAGLELTPLTIIGALLRAAPEYRPDYFRRLRNALAFDQEQRGHKHIAEEINRTLNPVTVLGLSRKCKQRRQQKISVDSFKRLVIALAERDLLVESGALLLIFMTGARPCELSGISIDENRIHIPGAKCSHGGLRGADRTLEAEEDICASINNALAALNSKVKSIDAVRVAINDVVREIFPAKQRPSMYTLRHQFGANLKASGLSRVEIAYMMGHQATDSINRYGDKRFGRASAVKVRPASGIDLSSVRNTHIKNFGLKHTFKSKMLIQGLLK